MSAIPNVAYTHLFPVPFLAHLWAENSGLNDELRLRILDHAREVPGDTRSNVGGWHSPTGQLEFLGALRDRLVDQMYRLAEEATRRVFEEAASPLAPIDWSLAAWATVSHSGDAHQPHTHPGATWSGVYYVDAGADTRKQGSPLQFIDPCQGRANTFFPFLLPSTVRVHPRPGLMVLFPSYLSHAVQGHRGDGARVSIAFNLRKEPFP